MARGTRAGAQGWSLTPQLPGVAAVKIADAGLGPMQEPGVREEHQGALAGDYVDVVRFTEGDGFAADSSGASSAIHPDAGDTGFGTIANHEIGDHGRS